MMEAYIFLDDNNVVINNIVFDVDAATDESIENVKNVLGASKVVLLGSKNKNNTVFNIENVFGNPDIGNEWDGIDTFRPPKPGDNYILDIYNINWVEVPSE